MDISNDTFKAIFSFQHHIMREDLAHVNIEEATLGNRQQSTLIITNV